MKSSTYVTRRLRPRQPRLADEPTVEHTTPVVGAACEELCEVETRHLEDIRSAQNAMPHGDDIMHMVKLFSLLSNETRLKLLLALEPGMRSPRRELCVCDLATLADASQSMTSHQLGMLRGAGLVAYRRVGKLAMYRLTDGPAEHLLRDAIEHVTERRI